MENPLQDSIGFLTKAGRSLKASSQSETQTPIASGLKRPFRSQGAPPHCEVPD